MANLALLVPVLLFALLITEGEPVRCWSCSTDLNQNCDDPMNKHDGDPYEVPLRDCDVDTRGITDPYVTTTKSSCKVQKKYIRGQMVITRGCTWKRADDYSTSCPNLYTAPDEVTAFCETCNYDGCNGASADNLIHKINNTRN